MGLRDTIAMSVLLGINSLAIGLRIFIRAVVRKAFGYDDYVVCLAYIGYVVFCSMVFVSTSYGFGTPYITPGDDPKKAAKFFIIAEIVYAPTANLARLSTGLILYRITKRITGIVPWTLIVSWVIISLPAVASTLMLSLQCIPLPTAWGDSDGTCAPASVLASAGFLVSATDILTSCLYIGDNSCSL
ncbi:hypothetical protein BX600DRAFT_519311 [Xylariales sp. PMI_506]|nr:hypothetical protein BX600DRAFT_519311 [Xylariales sp. PMI_506]